MGKKLDTAIKIAKKTGEIAAVVATVAGTIAGMSKKN